MSKWVWLCGLLFVVALTSAQGSVITWDGGGDGSSWTNRFNWTGDALPAATDDVVIAGSPGTVQIAGADISVRSLLCDRALALSNAHLRVGSGTSRVMGVFSAVGASSLYVNNAGTAFFSEGPALLDGASLYANSGARLSLPQATNVAARSCGLIYLQASGAGSVLDLPGLTNLVGSGCGTVYLGGYNGGRLALSNLVTFGNVSIWLTSDGSNSVVALPSLLEHAGTNGQFDIFLNAGGTMLAPSLRSLDRTSYLWASSGSTLALPGLQNLVRTNCSLSAEFRATGPGSRLELPGLTNVTSAGCQQLYIYALSGGQVLASNVVRLGAGTVAVQADGSNSVVALDGLRGYEGLTGGLTLEARNYGTIRAGQLTSAPGAVLRLGTGGALDVGELRELVSGSVYVSGGATLSLPQVTNYMVSGCPTLYLESRGAGSVLDLPGLTNLVGSGCGTVYLASYSGGRLALSNLVTFGNVNIWLTSDGSNSVVALPSLLEHAGTNGQFDIFLSAGGTMLAPSLRSLERTYYLWASSGSTLVLPGLQNLVRTNCGLSADFRVTGPGSRLELPSLATIRSASCHLTYLSAQDRGVIEAGQLEYLGEGYCQVFANGTGSVINLSSLSAIISRTSQSKLDARNGGQILLSPDGCLLSRVDVMLPPGHPYLPPTFLSGTDLALYGVVGRSYLVESRDFSGDGAWGLLSRVPQTAAVVSVASSPPTNLMLRASVFVADPPIIEIRQKPDGELEGLLYGPTGRTFRLQASTNLLQAAAWQDGELFFLTNSFYFIGDLQAPPAILHYRVKEQ